MITQSRGWKFEPSRGSFHFLLEVRTLEGVSRMNGCEAVQDNKSVAMVRCIFASGCMIGVTLSVGDL
jgi:hypothetical protein